MYSRYPDPLRGKGLLLQVPKRAAPHAAAAGGSCKQPAALAPRCAALLLLLLASLAASRLRHALHDGLSFHDLAPGALQQLRAPGGCACLAELPRACACACLPGGTGGVERTASPPAATHPQPQARWRGWPQPARCWWPAATASCAAVR